MENETVQLSVWLIRLDELLSTSADIIKQWTEGQSVAECHWHPEIAIVALITLLEKVLLFCISRIHLNGKGKRGVKKKVKGRGASKKQHC